jgi:hypothetical protein
MSSDFKQLAQKYHAFYEVSPYYALVEERHGSPGESKQLIQSGFDVDVHGVSEKGNVDIPPADEYALGYARLKEQMAETVSRHASECVIDVIAFPSTAFTAPSRPLQSEAIIRIRISHRGGDQAVGVAEQHALEEVEKQLKGLAIPRR